jgi:hypothetical protein
MRVWPRSPATCDTVCWLVTLLGGEEPDVWRAKLRQTRHKFLCAGRSLAGKALNRNKLRPDVGAGRDGVCADNSNALPAFGDFYCDLVPHGRMTPADIG